MKTLLQICPILVACGLCAEEARVIDVVERGQDHRVVQTIISELDEYGERLYSTNRIVELGSSMHYFDPESQSWKETQATFELVNGRAEALKGPHKVTLAQNIGTERSVSLTDSKGQLFQSTPLMLIFRDTATGESVGIGIIQDSIGEQISPNQILYPNAMEGVQCALRYTYRQNGFEQELLIQEPLNPEEWGMQPGPTVQLELWTGFYTHPAIVEARAVEAEGKPDTYLDFGALQIGAGKAFGIAMFAPEGPVTKRFGPIEGDARNWLVEAISMEDLKALNKGLQAAREGKQVERNKRLAGRKAKNSKDLLAMMQLSKKDRSTDQAMIQKRERPLGPAISLDYSTINGSFGTFTFCRDTTYYISADTTFGGAGATVTFEGGAVLKYGSNVKITLNCPIVWGGSAYSPVILTAYDDSSVGEKPAGATSPSGQYAAIALEINANTAGADALLKHVSIRHAKVGISIVGRTGHSIDHAQFVNCGYGVKLSSGAKTFVRNALLDNVTTNFSGTLCVVRGEHITSRTASHFMSDLGGCTLTNSLLVGITTVGTLSSPDNVQTLSSATGVFSSVANGASYLATDVYRNVGNNMTSINAELKTKTTYPPIVISSSFTVPTTLYPQAQRDTDQVDLGYHYEPLDYVWGTLNLSSSLLLTNGVAVGITDSKGLTLQTGAKLYSQGKPNALNRLVRYNAVQEKAVLLGTYTTSMSLIEHTTTGINPTLYFRFTEVSLLGVATNAVEMLFSAIGGGPSMNMTLRDCELKGVNSTFKCLGSETVRLGWTNNVWLRSKITINNNPSGTGLALTHDFRNNLVRGGSLTFTYAAGTGSYTVKDNLFDTVSLTAGTGAGFTRSHNAYVATTAMSGGSNDQFPTTLDFQSGPLGTYYYNTSGSGTFALVNAGSITPSSNHGFHHYTVRTDQTKEAATQLDIGFHSMATAGSTDSTPKDTELDGIADYMGDLDGDDVVDSGETDWDAPDQGLAVRILRPNSQSKLP